MFDERRAAQAAAFFLHRDGGTMPLLKLIKLIYLAERLSFMRFGEPLVGDKLVSMDHGPVLSHVYNLMCGRVDSIDRGWNTYIGPRHGHYLSLLDSACIESPDNDLRALSTSDVKILNDVWREFGHVNRFDLVDYLHEHMPEWEHPHGSSRPITYDRLFAALGYSEKQSRILKDRMAEQDYIAQSAAS